MVQEGLTPILAAVLQNERELVVLLITHGATVNCYKVKHPQWNSPQYFYVCRDESGNHTYTQLHKLRVGGGDRMLEVSPLSCAAARGSVEMVKLLVQHEANVNATAVSVIFLAGWKNLS